MNNYNYNSSKPPLRLKEYGRNVQKLVEYIMVQEDKENRTRLATALIDLMRQVVPTARDNVDQSQRLWDDLYLMSNFQLDVNSPYPMPPKDILSKPPEKVAYPVKLRRYKHYGKNLQMMVRKAADLEDEEFRYKTVAYLGRLMKQFYIEWNRDNVETEVIIENLKDISSQKLEFDEQKMKSENPFDVSKFKQNNNRSSSSNTKKRNMSNSNTNNNNYKKRK